MRLNNFQISFQKSFPKQAMDYASDNCTINCGKTIAGLGSVFMFKDRSP